MTRIGSFPKLQPTYGSGISQNVTEESIYWQQFDKVKQFEDKGTASSISFSPTLPFDFLVVSMGRVVCYSGASMEQSFVLNIRSDVPRCAIFRPDSRIIAIGVEDGKILIFDPNTRRVVDSFKAHNGPCNHLAYTYDLHYLISTGEDGTLRVFDPESHEQVACTTAHADYIRDLQLTPFSPDLVATASYDRKVLVWKISSLMKDYQEAKQQKQKQAAESNEAVSKPSPLSSTQIESASAPLYTFTHSNPVESIVFYPGGSHIAAASLFSLILSFIIL